MGGGGSLQLPAANPPGLCRKICSHSAGVSSCRQGQLGTAIVGEKHKHRCTDQFADKEAYVPDDITVLPEDAVAVWRQFCAEAKIMHQGSLERPPAAQLELGL